MFHIQKPCQHQLVQVNIIIEKHGEEDHPALDLHLMVECGASVLEMFYTGMRALFYMPDDHGKLTRLRYPKLGELTINDELSGRAMTLDYGLGDSGQGQQTLELGQEHSSNMDLAGVRAKTFKFALQEEGRLILSYRIIVPKASSETIGRIGSLKKQKVWIALPVDPADLITPDLDGSAPDAGDAAGPAGDDENDDDSNGSEDTGGGEDHGEAGDDGGEAGEAGAAPGPDGEDSATEQWLAQHGAAPG